MNEQTVFRIRNASMARKRFDSRSHVASSRFRKVGSMDPLEMKQDTLDAMLDDRDLRHSSFFAIPFTKEACERCLLGSRSVSIEEKGFDLLKKGISNRWIARYQPYLHKSGSKFCVSLNLSPLDPSLHV
jgi:hypothetical protein